MTTTTFDTLAYFEKLKAAGTPEEQAKVQAAAFRDFAFLQDEATKKELATKQDLQIALKELELRLQTEAQKNKYDLLKWQLGIGLAIIVVMAKGFGWLGF